MTALEDPYKWWVGQRVDVLQDTFTWKLGEVTEAERGVVHPFGDFGDEPEFYEATYLGDSDGHLRVIMLDNETRGDFVSSEIFPGQPIGIVPGITPVGSFAVEVTTWWRALSVEAKSALSDDPDGFVPGFVLPEVVTKGAVPIGTFWTSTQSAPEGFRLPQRYVDLITDVKLTRAYIADERRLQGLLSNDGAPPPATPVVLGLEQREAWAARNSSKAALDQHRIALKAQGSS